MFEHRVSRLFSILGQLSPHSQVTVHELCREYELDSKTIQRDIEMLQEAKIGVFYDDDKIKISRIGYKRIRRWMLG